MSSGGTAISQSTGTGNANVSTAAVAMDGGRAHAEQTASSGTRSKTVISTGNYSTSVERHQPSSAAGWEGAPTCRFSPTGEPGHHLIAAHGTDSSLVQQAQRLVKVSSLLLIACQFACTRLPDPLVDVQEVLACLHPAA